MLQNMADLDSAVLAQNLKSYIYIHIYTCNLGLLWDYEF